MRDLLNSQTLRVDTTPDVMLTLGGLGMARQTCGNALSRICVAGGLLLAPGNFAWGEVNVRRPVVIDATLDADSGLHGQLVDANGAALRERDIVLLARGRVVARSGTDERGEFVMGNVAGGVYVLTDGVGALGIRVWNPKTAPPQARKRVLLVSEGIAARGQRPGGLERGFLSDASAAQYLAIGLGAAGIGALVADDSPSSP